MGKKGKGRKKGGKKDKKKEDENAITEVDKEFYELQIVDLNRKLARMRSRCAELELASEELSKQMTKLEEDRGDVISYLNRSLQEKEALIEEQQDRIQGLIELRDQETMAFRNKVDAMDKEFRAMQMQLSSEVKLLGGKLNALDEFRVQRDELMEKFAKQEEMMEEQEKLHAREVYLVERKFILAKDRLKKEMENRLLRLSTDVQNATEARIASTTHRVIRENIAINNELDLMMSATREFSEESDKMRKKDQELVLAVELHEREKVIAIRRSDTQKKHIDRLSIEHAKMVERVKELSYHQEQAEEYRERLSAAEDKYHAACVEARLLRQDLAKCSSDNDQATSRVDTMRAYVNRMEAHMGAAVKAIKQTLQIENQTDIDEAERISIRDNLLCILLEILSQYDYCNLEPPPTETGSMTTYQLSLGPCSGTYEKGDLGLVPRQHQDVCIPK